MVPVEAKMHLIHKEQDADRAPWIFAEKKEKEEIMKILHDNKLDHVKHGLTYQQVASSYSPAYDSNHLCYVNGRPRNDGRRRCSLEALCCSANFSDSRTAAGNNGPRKADKLSFECTPLNQITEDRSEASVHSADQDDELMEKLMIVFMDRSALIGVL
eukprot:3721546-Amphidinium_carterae.2